VPLKGLAIQFDDYDRPIKFLKNLKT